MSFWKFCIQLSIAFNLFLPCNAVLALYASKRDEKQQLLSFFFSNLTLDGEKLDLELREPFNLMANVSDRHVWRQILSALRTFRWNSLKEQRL